MPLSPLPEIVTKLRRARSRRWIMNTDSDSASRTIARIAARPGILLHAHDREIDRDRQHFEISTEQQRVAEVGEAFDEHEQERVDRTQAPSAAA